MKLQPMLNSWPSWKSKSRTQPVWPPRVASNEPFGAKRLAARPAPPPTATKPVLGSTATEKKGLPKPGSAASWSRVHDPPGTSSHHSAPRAAATTRRAVPVGPGGSAARARGPAATPEITSETLKVQLTRPSMVSIGCAGCETVQF